MTVQSKLFFMKPKWFTRRERLRFARDFHRRIKDMFSENLVAVGIYGSVARHKDQPYSDLEMLAILKKPYPHHAFEGIYRGLKYEVNFYTRAEMRKEISTIDIDWPVKVGQYLKVLPIYDPRNVFDNIAREYEKIIKKDFKPYIAEAFYCDVFELFSKFFNAREKREHKSVRYLAFMICDSVSKLLGLINKKCFYSITDRYQETIKMRKNFPSFIGLMEHVVSGKMEDTEELSFLAEQLYQEIILYLEEEDIPYMIEESTPF